LFWALLTVSSAIFFVMRLPIVVMLGLIFAASAIRLAMYVLTATVIGREQNISDT